MGGLCLLRGTAAFLALMSICTNFAQAQMHADFLRIGSRDINKGAFGFPNHFTPAQEHRQGTEMDAQIRRRFEPGGNSEISSYLQRLAEEIWRRSDLSGPIAVHVVRNQEHLAFSTLAGYIYVDEKLIRIAENESELAGALAHEIAHLAARHAAENITRMRLLEANPGWIATLLKPCRVFRAYLTTGGLNGFWRAVYCGNEIEADELATQYLWNSGFDPEGVLNLLVAIKDGEWVDLPAGPKREAWNAPVSLRQKRIRELLKRLPALDTPRLDSSDFAEVREHLRQSSLTRLSHR